MRAAEDATPAMPPLAALDRDANYSVNAKALRRWASERLKLVHNDDGTADAHFRYEGTTCSNMGRTLAFDYSVRIGTRENRYRILEQECAPARGDEGHTFMCKYKIGASQLMTSIAEEKPLLGRPLNDVLSWRRPASGPTCYCEGESREQKWGAVLETIHYALVQRDALNDETNTPLQPGTR